MIKLLVRFEVKRKDILVKTKTKLMEFMVTSDRFGLDECSEVIRFVNCKVQWQNNGRPIEGTPIIRLIRMCLSDRLMW